MDSVRSRYTSSTYGDAWADIYDRFADSVPHAGPQTMATVDFIARRAKASPVLELGVGTGRIAIPLAARGLAVVGIEASAEMLRVLRAKPGSEAVDVVVGDFANVDVPKTFSVAFAAYSTLFFLDSQEHQVQCFERVASHLLSDGNFIIDVFVPDLRRFPGGQRIGISDVEVGRVTMEVSKIDPIAQKIFRQHVTISAAGVDMRPVHLRYAWPSELDLMARLAGLELHERWASWMEEPFTASSHRHVSVYVKSRSS